MFAWEQRKLGEVATRVTRKNKNLESTLPLTISAQLGLVDQISYFDKRIASSNLTNYILLNRGEFAYNKSYSNGYPFGTVKRLNRYDKGVIPSLYIAFMPNTIFINSDFMEMYFETSLWHKEVSTRASEGARNHGLLNISPSDFMDIYMKIPEKIEEQKKIAKFLEDFDSLIALHQRKPFIKNGGIKMITSNFTCDSLFKDYFEFWIKLYKEGAVRPVTLEKYRNNQKHIAKIIPNLKMKDFDRNAYQELLNQYALTHERQTVIDFHHQVKGAILDAVDDGLIDRDPTRKAIFKGKAPREKKQKYLNQFELHNLLEDLDLGMEITWDWLILLIAKTGLRFSEALGLTPADFDFARQTISVNKTWDYKTNTGFQPTKNRSSIRKVQMDWQLGMQFQHLIKNLNEDEPIFVNGPVCNSTPNNCLARHCRKCGIPEISIHGLRHTHASLLMFAGVSIASVSRRLGITTTQKVYMHIISELENQDNDLVMRYLSSLS